MPGGGLGGASAPPRWAGSRWRPFARSLACAARPGALWAERGVRGRARSEAALLQEIGRTRLAERP
eukprot:295137-Alexandrium_andersonii.AAC.1